MDRQEIERRVRSEKPFERLQLLDVAPPSSVEDSIRFLIASDRRTSQILGWNSVIVAAAYGAHPRFGADLALAVHSVALEVWNDVHDSEGLQYQTVGGLASSAAHALNLCGEYEETVGFAEEYLPQHLLAGDTLNGPDLAAHAAEAALELRDIELADEFLAFAKTSIHHGRLSVLIEQLRATPDVMGSERGWRRPDRGRGSALQHLKSALAAESKPTPSIESIEAFRDGLKGAVEGMVGDLGSRLGLDQAKMSPEKALRALTELGKLSQLVDNLPHQMAQGDSFRATLKIQKASEAVLLSDQSFDRASLEAARAEIRAVRDWAQAEGRTMILHSAFWIISLCCRRLGDYEEGVDALQRLRSSLETMRASIANPAERAGVLALYPTLFGCLCEDLTKLNRPDQLLDAIEASKGRSVIELLTRRDGVPRTEAEVSEAVVRLPHLLQDAQAHYLSFFVDETATYGVLLAKDGSFHASGPIDLRKKDMPTTEGAINPTNFGMPDLSKGFGGPRIPAWPRTLSSLLAWLEPLLEGGVLQSGDHLAISPDQPLHLLPMHLLEFLGRPLAHFFSVSRIHGALFLVSTLERSPARPTEAVSVEVPAEQDVERGLDKGFSQMGLRLERQMPTKRLVGVEARPEQVAKSALADRLVHMTTHGFFPELGNPYRCSGLYLARRDGLPILQAIESPEEVPDGFLSPEVALELNLDLWSSHVSLSACVTGMATEGIGGDALGMDWALSRLGASSLLVTHWDVSGSLSFEFFARFYNRWLKEGESRGQAWRNVLLELTEEERPLSDPYVWGAISLVGDWR